MRYLVIATALLTLSLGTGTTLASDADVRANATSSPVIRPAEEGDSVTGTDDPHEYGLSVLSKRPFKLGWGAIFDVVSTDERLVAVGYAATYDKSHGAAWTSLDGRKWKKTHRLPDWTFYHALPIADGAVLASRDARGGCHARMWRLEPDGKIVKSGLIWPTKRGCPGTELGGIAGRPEAGMIAAYEARGRREAPKVVWRKPGGPWKRVKLQGLGRARGWPVEVVATTSGFVLIAESDRGVMSWRSPRGHEWIGPELLPDSVPHRDRYARTSMVYDEDRDILLVLSTPDRVWRSVAGGPFEPTGPLAAPVETDDGVFAGTALSDGFLVTISDDGGMRLQTSPDGVTWTRAPDDQDDEHAFADWVLRHGDRVIIGSERSGVMGGPATIAAYLPALDAADAAARP